MKYLIALTFFCSVAFAQLTDAPLGVVSISDEAGKEDVKYELPKGAVQIKESEAFDQVFLTTETVTTSTGRTVWELQDGKKVEREMVIKTVTRVLIEPSTWTLRLKPGCFLGPYDGEFYRIEKAQAETPRIK